jgi:hypothetical protein
MARASPQLNIRSAFARDRAAELARRTGMTTTQVVEEALRAYAPPAPATNDADETLPPGLVRKGRLLVLTGGPYLTADEWQAEIEAAREERALYIEGAVAEED